MQDSNIVYTVKAVGVEEATSKFNQLGATIQKLKFNADGSVTASGKLAGATDELSKSTDKAAQATDRASKSQQGYFGHIAKTTVQSALINKLFLELVDVSGQAVKQVDLMNNFPATMKSMGQSVEDSNVALKSLRDYVGQIGGNLGTATSFVTRFTGVTKDVKGAVAIFQGLNNALIAGDSSTEEQRLAMIQFAQALERGKPDMREWMALTQNMSFQLGLVAKSMGYVNTNALGEALRNGEESMAAFTTTLTELSTGTGPIAKQALTRMQGTEFAFNVMKNTMVQGLAAIINAFNRTNIVSFFSFLTQVIQVLSQAVVTLISWMFILINAISRLFGGGDIAKLGTDASVLAENLANAEDSSGGIGDGLKGAEKDAKKLQKSLAAFDKMNVLPDPTDSKADSGGGAGSNFDNTQVSKLGDLFGQIGGKLQEVSIWAKIFAGILGGLAALKVGQGFLNQLNGLAKTFEETSKNVGKMQDSFKKMTDSFKDSMKTMKDSYEKNVLKGMDDGNKINTIGSKVGNGFVSGFSGAIGGLASKALPLIAAAFAPIGAAIGGVLAAGAAALGVSVGVFVAIIAAVVAVVVGLIYIIWKNWDTIWGWVKTAASATWQFIQKVWDGLTGFFVNLWHSIIDTLRPVIDALAIIFKNVWDVIKALVTVAIGFILLPFQLLFSFFIALVGAVVWVAQQIWQAFQTAWDFITNIFIKAYQWFYDNVVLKIWEAIKLVVGFISEVFSAAWGTITNIFSVVWQWFYDNVVTKIKEAVEPIVGWFTERFKNAWDNITGAFGNVFKWFNDNIVTPIKNAINPVTSWIGDRFTDAWERIKRGFVNIWDFITDILSKFNPVGLIKSGINLLFGALESVVNAFIGIYRKIWDVVDKAPGGNIMPKPPANVSLTRLATGGIVNQPTMAMVGEAGAEAVMPLENNTQWIDKLASSINKSPSQPQNSDIIPVTNKKDQPTTKIEINVAGVFATSVQEQKRIAEIIGKQVEQSLRAKGFKGAY